MDMYDVAYTAAEKKEKKKDMESPVGGDKYPWGLRLHLDDDCLKKLHITELPEVGGKMMISAWANVRGVDQQETSSGKERSIDLQITNLGVHEEDYSDLDPKDPDYLKKAGDRMGMTKKKEEAKA